ncbi:hypothetical protein OP10G_3502 [Fimbriimonas ginsengisoli Gsoil 348]|uniref:Uncharacterized protein n=1 Tax=Fimbriimonas ginsengisoli Gsoil 348 TaxID=661478 RepID=A0A068NVP9_FIMGI|nr:hypothetical protein OP10G_3502 [Fimbriimonas ginsengisoli Gsoil 348]
MACGLIEPFGIQLGQASISYSSNAVAAQLPGILSCRTTRFLTQWKT